MENREVPCNLCGGSRTRLCFRASDLLLHTAHDLAVVKCLDCGLIFLNPQPDQSRRLDYFPDNYPLYEVAFGRKSADISRYNDRRDRIEAKKSGHTFLDMGCMDGQMMANLREHGWDVYGFDIKPEAVEFARTKLGLEKATVGDLFDQSYPEKFFDVVDIWGVLEDASDPMANLKKVRTLLKDDGLLVIATHNVESPEARFFGKTWFNLEIPRHLYHFSPATLRLMLEKAGYKVLEIKHFASLYVLEMSLLNRFRRRSLVINPVLESLVYRPYVALAPRLSSGTMIEAYAVKT